MIVVNKPGGGGTIGTTEALNAKPDGYTVLITGWGPFVTQPFLMDVPYGEDDYEVLLQLSRYPRILCAKKDAPYNDIKEMMAYAKANPEKVIVGIASVGTTGHLAMAQLESEYGVKFTMVPQGGGGPQKVAVLGGHVDVAPLTASEGGPLVTSGQVKALAVMDDQRFAEIPDIKTGAELGYPIESGVASHVFVPAGTPADIKKMLHDAFKNCLEDKVFKQVSVKLNLGAQYADAEFAKKDIAKFRKIYEKVSAELGLKKK
jgi:tripartite-type tricarboxylate transporter receptor subunit TctC